MNDTGTKTMRIRRENVAAMTTQRAREPTNLHLSLATAFYIPSRASIVNHFSGDEQLTTTVHLHRHDISGPDMPYEGSVCENFVPLAHGKPRHRHIPLPSQIESDTAIITHPLLLATRGEKIVELDFARSLSSVHVLGHEGCMKEAATNPPLPSLAIVYPKLPWSVVIQRSGDQEWVTVADIVEMLWHALQILVPLRTSSPLSLLKNKEATFNSCRGMSCRVEREMAPRLVYLEGKTRFMGLRAIGGDNWELLVA